MNQPQIIGHYRIIKHLGSGGFGETFLVEDVHLPSSKVFVLKQLKPMNNNPQIYELVKDRFHREAVILEDLGNSHEQIPSLKAYFEENSLFYLAQEYIEGETLASLVQREGKQSESTVKSILIQTLEILEFIQDKKIIHRDIKPDNIIIRKSDNKPVLIDFGAVRETMATVMSSSGNSTSSIVIGTPGFMPSEQGIGRPVFSSDLYALGLTAIYLLTGKSPQDLNTDPLTGEIIWQDETLSLSPNLVNVLNKAIKSHSQERFITAKEMKLALISTSPNSPPTAISSPPNYPTPLPTTISSPPNYPTPIPTAISSSPNYPPTSPPNQKKLTWLWFILGGLGIIVILAAIALPAFLNQANKAKESEAKTYMSSMVKSQVEIYKDEGKFAKSVDELGVGISSETKNYEYEVQLLDENKSIISATPKADGISSFLGVVFINSEQIVYGICKSIEPSHQPPSIPDLSNVNFQCSDDSEFFAEANSTPIPEKFSRLSQEEAVAIVRRWYDAKPKVFAYPFDLNLVSQLSTGQLYYDTTKSGGSVDWLRQNNCYYTYNFSNIDQVWSFDNQGVRPVLRIRINEQLKLNGYGSCSQATQTYTKNVTYVFEKDNGTWKIYSYDVE